MLAAAYCRAPAREPDFLRGLLGRGLVSYGIVLQNPFAPQAEWFDAFEIRWLRGQPVPQFPPFINGCPVKIVIVDSYPIPY